MKILNEINDWEEMKNEVMHCDALELMKMIPDNAIDLVLTDPPYGIGISKNPIRQKHDKKEWDNKTPSKEMFSEILRVSKNQIIWGGNYFNLPVQGKNFLIWDKVQPFDFSLAMCEMAWTSLDSPAKIFKHSVRLEGANKHPTQKPIELMRWCLTNYAKDCKTVLDPFAGSFTTARACKDMGFDFIACDLEKDYCEIGEKRLLQETLF